ncbi:MAG: translesion DNA synthesis-associated protein ImuA [Gammaproteobacteria bacterium]|nr:translesion DNA synthesis-associated protein ImuA [Gammaproteobacteria bacterium]
MSTALNTLLQHRELWRANRLSQTGPATLPSGWPALDAELPGGGWPLAALTELRLDQAGVGELGLLLPALARLGREGRRIVLVAPPHIPYAPAWQAAGVVLSRVLWLSPTTSRERLWALEQSLREPSCAAVLGWWTGPLPDVQCRRLQLAANAGGGLGFLLRTGMTASAASPLHLRLGLEATPGGLTLRLLKRQGLPPARPLFLNYREEESGHALVSPVPARPAPGRPVARPRPVPA